MIPLRFRKAGRVQCGGARETRERRVRIERHLAQPRSFSNLISIIRIRKGRLAMSHSEILGPGII